MTPIGDFPVHCPGCRCREGGNYWTPAAQQHLFRQGGTLGTTFYIFCSCGWSAQVEKWEAADSKTQVQIGQKLWADHAQAATDKASDEA